MSNKFSAPKDVTRREALQAGLIGMGALGLPPFFARAADAMVKRISDHNDNRILVVLELSGGNDGLNTLVPYGDDAYYRQRPTIGIKPDKVLKIDDHFGFNPGLVGFERLFKDGKMAVAHGCGYDNPSFSHFTSMAYWHTAAPNSGEEYGWLGRLAATRSSRAARRITSSTSTPPNRWPCAAATMCRWCSTTRTSSPAKDSIRNSRCFITSRAPTARPIRHATTC